MAVGSLYIKLHFKTRLNDNYQIRKLGRLNPVYNDHEVPTALLAE
jgi:hypothetical protein